MNYVKFCWISFSLKQFANDVFRGFGVISTIITIAGVLGVEKYNFMLPLSLIVIICICFYKSRPKYSIKHKIKNSEITLEIKVGNILENKSAVVVPIDTRFEVGLNDIHNLKAEKSVLASVVQDFFWGQPAKLQDEINIIKELKSELGSIGDVILVTSGSKKFYFVANTVKYVGSDIVQTEQSFLDVVLNKMWKNIPSLTDKEVLSVPLLNTGYAGNHNTKSDVIKKIVTSFINAVKNEKVSYCNHLIITIHENDFYDGLFYEFKDLNSFLKHCADNAHIAPSGQVTSSEPRITSF
jgi:hypothetical protein